MALPDVMPFPYPIAIGTDICHIPRIRMILSDEREGYIHTLGRTIFSPVELSEFLSRLEKMQELRSAGGKEKDCMSLDLEGQLGEARPDEENQPDEKTSKHGRELAKFSGWVAGR